MGFVPRLFPMLPGKGMQDIVCQKFLAGKGDLTYPEFHWGIMPLPFGFVSCRVLGSSLSRGS